MTNRLLMSCHGPGASVIIPSTPFKASVIMPSLLYSVFYSRVTVYYTQTHLVLAFNNYRHISKLLQEQVLCHTVLQT